MALRGLTVSSRGELLRDGVRFRNIGLAWTGSIWAQYSASAANTNYYTSSAEQDRVLDIAQSMGVRVLLINPFPFYPNHWTYALNGGVAGAATAADREAYYLRIDALLDKMAARDMGAVFRMFQRHAAPSDLVGEFPRAGWLTAGATRDLASAITTEIAARYLNHSGFYGYQHGTETNHRNDISQPRFELDVWPAANVGLGTYAKATYTADNSAYFGGEWSEVLAWWYGVIQSVDPNRIVLSGNGPNSYNQPGGAQGISTPMIAWHREQVRDNPTNCGQIHFYGNIPYHSNNFRGLGGLLTGVRHWQQQRGRGFVLGEFGSQPWWTYSINSSGGIATFTCDPQVPLEVGDPFRMAGTGTAFDGTYTVATINGARDSLTAACPVAGSWSGTAKGLQFLTGARIARMCDDIIGSGTDLAFYWQIASDATQPLLESVDAVGNEGIRAAITAANARLATEAAQLAAEAAGAVTHWEDLNTWADVARWS